MKVIKLLLHSDISENGSLLLKHSQELPQAYRIKFSFLILVFQAFLHVVTPTFRLTTPLPAPVEPAMPNTQFCTLVSCLDPYVCAIFPSPIMPYSTSP